MSFADFLRFHWDADGVDRPHLPPMPFQPPPPVGAANNAGPAAALAPVAPRLAARPEAHVAVGAAAGAAADAVWSEEGGDGGGGVAAAAEPPGAAAAAAPPPPAAGGGGEEEEDAFGRQEGGHFDFADLPDGMDDGMADVELHVAVGSLGEEGGFFFGSGCLPNQLWHTWWLSWCLAIPVMPSLTA
jgi:hypothetical protein